MFPYKDKRFFAFLSTFLLFCSFLSAPATAQRPHRAYLSASMLVDFYTHFVRSTNPRLALTQCRSYARDVVADAQRRNFDPALLAAIVTVESHWDPSARSKHGAEGLGQLMPATARELGVNPRSAHENILGTSIYVHRLLGAFHGTREQLRYAIASYNAGPGAVQRYGGVPPTYETRRYVFKVMRTLNDVHAKSRRYAVDRTIEVD